MRLPLHRHHLRRIEHSVNIQSTALERHPPAPDSVRELATHLDSILGPLLLLIAAQFRRLGPHYLTLWNRISRARQRLARLLAQLAAGTLAPPRTRPSQAGRPGGPPAAPLPRGHAWVIAMLGYHAAGRASQLNTLLSDPATAAILAAAPGAARTLRPLCRMLGIDLPPYLQPPRTSADPDSNATAPAAPASAKPRRRIAKQPPFTLRPEPAAAPILIFFPTTG